MAKKKNVHAQALARLGASKGGKARAEKLSAKELSEQGRNAVLARWAKARAAKKKAGATTPSRRRQPKVS
jgi:hypothetical protein